MSSDDTHDLEQTALEVEAALRESRARLAEAPVEVVIANHVLAFYELAAIHLSAQPPNLGAAATAIDAMSSVVHTLEGRLGADEDTMRDALQNIQFAFVQIKASQPG
jgi:hypothetical protein